MQVESITIKAALPASPVDASGNKAAVTGSAGESSYPASSPGAKQPETKLTFPANADAQPEKALQSIQDAVKDSNIILKFSRDDDSGAIVVKWVDQASGEAIQQIPSEALLHLAATLGKLQGQFFNRKA